MSVIVGIPARMASTRLPGKPLVDICGMAMIEHVYRRAKMVFPEVYIATPDSEIIDYCNGYQMAFVLVKDEPKPVRKPGERIFRMAKIMEAKDDDILVTIQGDEPFVSPTSLNLLESFSHFLEKESTVKYDMLHMMVPCNDEDWHNHSEIKVFCDNVCNAMYFTRDYVPSFAFSEVYGQVQVNKQLCLFAMSYKIAKSFYHNFDLIDASNPKSIEMQIALEYGYKVKMIPDTYKSKSVDTQEDLAKARKMMRYDKLYPKYRR